MLFCSSLSCYSVFCVLVFPFSYRFFLASSPGHSQVLIWWCFQTLSKKNNLGVAWGQERISPQKKTTLFRVRLHHNNKDIMFLVQYLASTAVQRLWWPQAPLSDCGGHRPPLSDCGGHRPPLSDCGGHRHLSVTVVATGTSQ